MLIKKVHILCILFVVVLFLLCITSFSLGGSESVHEHANTIVRCIEKERQALLMFEQGVVDNYGGLSSWGSEEDKKDCCKWEGVGCSNLTGHVTSLDLSALKHVSIKMTSSLIELKSLHYLSLRFNDFGSMPIPNFIYSLTSLVSLDLVDSKLSGPIPYQLGNLSKLKHLDLGYNEGLYVKDGNLEWLSRLSSLTDLDLSGVDLSRANGWVDIIKALPFLSNLNLDACNLSQVITPSLSSANSSSSISDLVLSSNDLTFSTSRWLFNLSSSLVDLDLSGNLLKDSIPDAFGYHLTSLEHLSLEYNQVEGVVPKTLGTLCNLKSLWLGWNNLTGSLEDFSSGCAANSLESLDLFHNQFNWPLIDFKEWPSLKRLDLSGNQLAGPLDEFKGWPSLQELVLANNQLTGPIPAFKECPSLDFLDLSHNQFAGPLIDFKGCQSLKRLYLSSNQLAGPLDKFKGWPSLQVLVLANNQLTGPIPVFRKCPSLESLDLSDNQFSALLPETFGQLLNLKALDISKNSLQVVITKEHFSNLSSLSSLDLSFNTIHFNWSSQHVSRLQLSELRMRSCKLRPQFPEWIKTQMSLELLDLSNNEISDSIPTWFWDLIGGMTYLNLSSNKIKGILPNVSSSVFAKYSLVLEIDLSSNNLEGPIPSFLVNGSSLNLSKNNFSGTLSFLQARPTRGYLQYLDVSHNHLSGEIPDFWMNFKNMVILNFAYNNMSGGIPSSLGFLTWLEVLNLHSNMFSGELPMSLKNCTQLRFLNLGANKFSGYIPAWIGEISELYVLIMRSNGFFGSIPLQLCQLGNLQLLDLSTNNISGKIPGCFNNFTGMIQQPRTISKVVEHSYARYDESNPYYDNAPIVWKGGEREIGKNLEYVMSIDLSSNKLSGELPETIFALLELVSFSISNNNICGNIPPEIGNLKKLESLNLSNNRISGGIPLSMSYLYFLSYLDLSNNNLSGKIPTSTQLQSFDASMYTGNYALCGAPLVQKCSGDEPPPVPSISPSNEEGIDEFDRWFFIGAALGFSTTFWGICGALFLNRRWRHAYFFYLNNLKDWVYVTVKVYVAKLRRI